MAKHVLVTGLGFIGRHVVGELKKRGCSVSALERKPDVEEALALGVRPIVGDVRDADLVSQIVPEFDGVINLAGLLGTAEMMDDPVPAIGTNIVGAVNVFQACRRAGKLGRVVPCVQITAANHFMDNPYSITKSTADRFARMFNSGHGTDIRIVRALNVYGEWQKNFPVRKVVPNFIHAALEGKPLKVYGSGGQIMDLIYAGDVARILVNTLWAESPGDIISAGTGRPLTVLEVARTVIEAVGSRSEIVHAPMRAGEPEHSVVVGEPETLPQIGIDPRELVRFEDGVRTTAAWYRQNRDFLV
ncbi:MAG: NAD-dependent epimerase/dehydratase family protein [Bryobacteraceae bacterium]